MRRQASGGSGRPDRSESGGGVRVGDLVEEAVDTSTKAQSDATLTIASNGALPRAEAVWELLALGGLERHFAEGSRQRYPRAVLPDATDG